MNDAKWIDDVKADDLPAQYAEMVTLVGVKVTMILADYYKKTPFYFVGMEKIIEKKKKEYIIANFKGNNHSQLARETGYSSRWVYDIIEAHYKTKRSQPGLFDEPEDEEG